MTATATSAVSTMFATSPTSPTSARCVKPIPSITLHSLAELEIIRHLLDPESPAEVPATILLHDTESGLPSREDQSSLTSVPPESDEGATPRSPVPPIINEDGTYAGATLDVAALLTQLEDASATLAGALRRDEEARSAALRDLESYDHAVAACGDAEHVRDRAHQVRLDAEALAEAAFAEEARGAAQRVLVLAARAEDDAGRLLDRRRTDADGLAQRLDLDRLLAERRRRADEDQARVAAAEKAGRVAAGVFRARTALDAGRLAEARTALDAVCQEDPDSHEAASLLEAVARQEFTERVVVTEEALWRARRQYRHSPLEAVTRLAALDVDGLPSELASQVFGEWARACARLCREQDVEAPLRYAPDPGRGAVLGRSGGVSPGAAQESPAGQDAGCARDAGGAGSAYVVVSSLGMGPGWHPGARINERYVRHARPLR